jgi:hypothetical protein
MTMILGRIKNIENEDGLAGFFASGVSACLQNPA